MLVKILKLIINELSNVMEANAARQATPAEWSQGAQAAPPGCPRVTTVRVSVGLMESLLRGVHCTCSGRRAGQAEPLAGRQLPRPFQFGFPPELLSP